MARRPVIGVTGAIGAGKTTVARMLADEGCLVADSDALARDALADPDVRAQLVTWWGEGVLDEGGAVDRAEVGRLVFASPAERRRLESLVHPWIERRRKAMFADAPAGAPALVIDAPLLYEAGVDRHCDAVIFVDARRELRLRRLAGARGWDESELAKREDSQLPLDEKRSRSDYVLSNDGDLQRLREQVRRTLNDILGPRRS